MDHGAIEQVARAEAFDASGMLTVPAEVVPDQLLQRQDQLPPSEKEPESMPSLASQPPPIACGWIAGQAAIAIPPPFIAITT